LIAFFTVQNLDAGVATGWFSIYFTLHQAIGTLIGFLFFTLLKIIIINLCIN